MYNLRKCFLYRHEDEFYFHTWTSEGAIKRHPEDCRKDHVYSFTKAVIENVKTGEVSEVFPDEITFMIEGGQDA
jgi:hypothetical protein